MTPPMFLLLLAARLLLAAVFALSGITKLIDRPGARRAMVDFGLPAQWARFAAPILSIAEVVVALLLLFAPLAWVGAVGALLLLAIFVGAIGVNLALGRTPDCNCFGQLHSAPIGWKTLVRNGVLAAVALVLVAQGPTGIPSLAATFAAFGALFAESSWMWIGAAILLLLATAIGLLTWFMVNLLRQNGRLLLRIEALERATGHVEEEGDETPVGLPVGTPAPAFALPRISGEVATLATLLNQPRARGKPLLLYFSNPSCAPCNGFMPQISEWQKQTRFGVVVISTGSVESNRTSVEQHALTDLLLQQDREVAEQFGVPATPGALFVDAQGRIASPVALGPDAIRALVQETLSAGALHLHLAQSAAAQRARQSNGNGAQPPRPNLLPLGSNPPTFALADLDGVGHTLEEQRGVETLLLFWNPDCGYCQRMLPKLREWEERTANAGAADSPRLLLLSAADANRHPADSLHAPILLDEGFRVGRAFGADGTPSALLINGEGKVASALVVGESAIFNLLMAGDPLTLHGTPPGNAHVNGN